jgi:hypothetical protein
MTKSALLAVLAVAGMAASANAVVSFSGATYTQNFDSLLNTGTANAWVQDSTIPGWIARRALPAPADWATYRAGLGADNAGALYSYGSASATDRALGSLSSGTPGTITFAVVFQNTTSDVLNSFDLSFVGEQWRMGGNTVATNPSLAQSLAFDFKTIASFAFTEVDAAATGYSSVPALNFTSPAFGSGTPAALDGNLPAHQASLSATGVAMTWNPGEFLILRWTDINDVNNDHGMGIDNVTFNAIPTPGAFALLGIAGVVMGRRKR